MTRDLNNLNQLIVDNLHKIRAIPFDVIVHIPRSGTIPASLLATYLVKPFASLDEYCEGKISVRKAKYQSLNRILLVDDSIRTGTQLKQAIDRVRTYRPDTEIYSLAVYSTTGHKRFAEATLCLSEHNEGHYIYPWFMWKTKRIKDCAVDMDGVLCRDCLKHEDDDGPEYLKFISNADLKFQTDFEIGAIVTSRLEKYRNQTEEWLHNNNINYSKLYMGPWESKEKRKGNQAAWKADVYQKTRKLLFIESSEKEAIEIAKISQKPVWCIDTQKRYE